MRKIREVLRLRAEGLSTREIGRSLNLGRGTVANYCKRIALAGFSWPLPDNVSDVDLERRLFPHCMSRTSRAPQPDWRYIHSELRRDGVTLQLLWMEYREVHTDGYGYSHFCDLYSKWEGKRSPSMRQRHPAGERLFVDYAGATIDITDSKTGEVRPAQLFVAALGASNDTYVEARWSQQLPDWISSHVRAFEYFGGVPAQVVCEI
jgi:transposase